MPKMKNQTIDLKSLFQQAQLAESCNVRLKEENATLRSRLAGNEAERDRLNTLLGTAIIPAPGYETLTNVLRGALEQAADGKGKERHANALPYAAQPMQTIGFLLHSSEGMLYQVIKKVQEANTQLENARRSGDEEALMAAKKFARSEMLGAINYLAGAIIYEDAHV